MSNDMTTKGNRYLIVDKSGVVVHPLF